MTFKATRFAELMHGGLASFEAERLLVEPGSDPTDRGIQLIQHRIAYLDVALNHTLHEEEDAGKGRKLLFQLGRGIFALMILALLVSLATVLTPWVDLADASMAFAFFTTLAITFGLGGEAARQRAQYWRRRRQISEELYLLSAAAVKYFPPDLLEEMTLSSNSMLARKASPNFHPPRLAKMRSK